MLDAFIGFAAINNSHDENLVALPYVFLSNDAPGVVGISEAFGSRQYHAAKM